jgi:protein O-mannosyl-transferase
MNPRKQTLLISLGLALLVAAVFWQMTKFGFVSFDDASYIQENPHVRDGLSPGGIIWAFTTSHHGYWHPVTWIAHMVICQFFGLNAGAHHAVSLLVHAANVLLLFGLLVQLTGCTGRSAFVAALFAIHPLHVESVAWIAELKDLLSTTFWILTVWSYMLYTQQNRRGKYWLAVATYAIGLMAKPMIVTLPAILILLDYWPLGRMLPANGKPGVPLRTLILEKVPFFALAAISCAITYLTTLFSGVVGSSAAYPLSVRLTNVVVSYATYIWKMCWPDRMACFYPFNVPEPWKVAVAAVFLAGLSILVIRYWKQHRFLATGWLWYLVALLPVIGFIQAGSQSMADRYSYVSLIGIFIMISWAAVDFLDHKSRMLWPMAVAIVLALSVRAWFQVGVWKDALTLSRHAVLVTSDNFQQYNNLGIHLADQGRYDEAISNYFESIKINPDFAWTRNNLGNALMAQGRLDAAVQEFWKALRLNPGYGEAHNNLGIALAKQEKFDEAISHFLDALKANPDNVGRQKNLLRAIGKLQDKEKAATYYRAALEIAEPADQQELADVIREKLSNP